MDFNYTKKRERRGKENKGGGKRRRVPAPSVAEEMKHFEETETDNANKYKSLCKKNTRKESSNRKLGGEGGEGGTQGLTYLETRKGAPGKTRNGGGTNPQGVGGVEKQNVHRRWEEFWLNAKIKGTSATHLRKAS